MAKAIISGDEIGIKICKALDIDPDLVRRVVLDTVGPFEPLVVYIEIYGDEKLLDIQWSLDGAKIEILEKV